MGPEAQDARGVAGPSSGAAQPRYNSDMFDDISRRDWLRTMGVAGAGALVVHESLLTPAGNGLSAAARRADGAIENTYDTFARHRDVMAEMIRRARQRTGTA